MKLAVVSPRYGREIAGGAEHAARTLATRLAADTQWTVEALTTCALDTTTWADHYPAGDEIIDGVNVRRFAVRGRRAADFDAATDLVVRRGKRATDREIEEWVIKQGPIAPDLIDAIAGTDADVVAFHPYLYHPTVAGLSRVASRTVLHPAAHDDPTIKLRCYKPVFGDAHGLAYWSTPEQRVVEHNFAGRVEARARRRPRHRHGCGRSRGGPAFDRSRRPAVPALPRPRRRRQGLSAPRRVLHRVIKRARTHRCGSCSPAQSPNRSRHPPTSWWPVASTTT